MNRHKISVDSGTLEVFEQIGEGYSGVIYRARKQDGQGYWAQDVALKVFKSKKLEPLFRSELQALMKVHSKYCVSIFGWASVGEQPALVLEYVQGVSLQQLSRDQRLSSSEISEICFQISEGLRDLESLGLCHGDLSPANILIDQFGRVRLLDFGLSGLEGPDGSFGTPKYLSSSRWSGAKATCSDDWVSLGIIQKELKEGGGHHWTPRRSGGRGQRKWRSSIFQNSFRVRRLGQG